jgi:predicted alpha/beta hydrolase family esterase
MFYDLTGTDYLGEGGSVRDISIEEAAEMKAAEKTAAAVAEQNVRILSAMNLTRRDAAAASDIAIHLQQWLGATLMELLSAGHVDDAPKIGEAAVMVMLNSRVQIGRALAAKGN